MLRPLCAVALLMVLACGASQAQEVKPLNLDELDAKELKDFLGPWIIKDERGKRQCRVVLKRETTIGGMQIDVDPKCQTVFPVMGEITAWRLMEGWEIRLADALRKTRVAFYTPDDTYVSREEVDGIFSISPAPRKK